MAPRLRPLLPGCQVLSSDRKAHGRVKVGWLGKGVWVTLVACLCKRWVEKDLAGRGEHGGEWFWAASHTTKRLLGRI